MRLAALSVRYRWPVLGALALITIGAASVLPRISFDFTPQGALRGQDDLLSYSQSFSDTFGHTDGVLLVVLESTGRKDALSTEALGWQRNVSKRISTIPGIQGVESMATLNIGPRPDAPSDNTDQTRIRQAVDEMTLLEGSLISSDRRVSSCVVQIGPESLGIADLSRIVDSVSQILEQVPPPSEYRVQLSGLPAMRTGIVDGLSADLLTLFPVAGVLFLVVLCLEFRRVSGAILPMIAVGCAIVWTVSLIVIRGESFNIISNILPFLLFVIGMANCVHVITRYAEESAEPGLDRLQAAGQTIEHMSVACFLTFLTTAIGFSALLWARSEQLQSLAVYAIAGMCFLYVTTIAILGGLLPSFAAPRYSPGDSGRTSGIAHITALAGRLVCRRPRTVLAFSLAIIGVFLWFAQTVVASSNLFETYDYDHPQMQTLRLVEEKLGGVVPLEVSLTGQADGVFLKPDTFRRVAQAQKSARKLESVISARSYVDLHNEAARRMGAALAMAPDDSARLKAQDAILRSYGSASHYDAFLTADSQRARIMLRVGDIGSKRMLVLLDRLGAELAALFADSGIEVRLTGTAQVHARAMDRFVSDMVTSLLGAALVIFVVIALLFHSLRIGLIAILPNVTPLAITWGYIGMRGYQMNAGNVIVFAIGLGIAVDDTIHFLARFRQEIKADGDALAAIERSYHGTGRAIVLTSVLIAAGLSVMMLSEFVPSRRFAELTCITIVGALLGDLFLLPACLTLFGKPQPIRNEC